jgi:hypothetical protein
MEHSKNITRIKQWLQVSGDNSLSLDSEDIDCVRKVTCGTEVNHKAVEYGMK